MNIDVLKEYKGQKQIVALTAYDYSFARLFDEAGADMILVGDSVGMVCQGHKDTKSVTMDHMVYHTECVARGVRRACLVADMPIGSYDDAPSAIMNAQRLIAAGAHAVKVEGGDVKIVFAVEALCQAGIPVVGHVGLTPQTAERFVVEGRDQEGAQRIADEACLLEGAGISALVLECVPMRLAEEITHTMLIPTIGIGAGRHCDGQILVSHDLLGLFPDFRPKFVRTFMQGAEEVKAAVQDYINAVREGEFPNEQECFKGKA